MPPRATVLIPTMAGRGPVLPYSVGSVLRQTVPDLEVFLLGDGVCDETRRAIRALMEQDPRIRFFDHPKHERRGEPNRHAALAEARGEIVCYLCDRDLMLPWHVETLLALLAGADFVHTLPFAIHTDGTVAARAAVDLSDPSDRASALSGLSPETGIPLSFAGHTLAMYRQLPYGWRTTPSDRFTDLYMWEQFLAHPPCRARSGTRPTVLYFPSYLRREWTAGRKAEELAYWTEQMQGAGWYEALLERLLDRLAEDRLHTAQRLRATFEIRLAKRIAQVRRIVRPRARLYGLMKRLSRRPPG